MTVGVISAAILLLLPTSALASGTPSGVHVDPGSPAGKEYQLPVTSARGEASGSNGSSSAPLFGSGITPSGPSSSGGASSGGSAAAGRGSTHRAAKAKTGSHAVASDKAGGNASAPAPASPAPLPAANVSDGSAGGSGWLALVGGGAVVLLLGGGGGLLVRRRVLGS